MNENELQYIHEEGWLKKDLFQLQFFDFCNSPVGDSLSCPALIGAYYP